MSDDVEPTPPEWIGTPWPPGNGDPGSVPVARCSCGAPATNQAVFERRDGSRFMADPVCNRHRYTLGKPPHARGVEVVDYYELPGP